MNTTLQALCMTGREVAGYPLRISRSKTAIMPVNTSFLPRSMEEREQCSRTIYVSNLDKQVREDVKPPNSASPNQKSIQNK